MLAVNNAPERAQWEVLWVKDKKVHRKDFGHDLMGAIALNYKLKEADRTGVTLRCKNMGFPPPEHLARRKVKGKLKGKIVEGYVNPMKKKNVEGIFWCPYCQHLRRFVVKATYKVDTVMIGDGRLQCPMCRVTTRDHNVRKYNPLAVKIFYEEEEKQVRAPAKTTKVRKQAYRRKRRRRRNRSED